MAKEIQLLIPRTADSPSPHQGVPLLAGGLLVITMFNLSATVSPAQSTTEADQSSREHQQSFEVASVKENKRGGNAASNVPLDRGDAYSATGGNFTAINQPLIAYLIFAYKVKISETRSGLMHNLPEWAVTDRFDVIAKSESQNPSKDDVRLMLQSLLEERFKLKVHRESKQMPVLGLHPIKAGVVGPQLKPHDPNSSCLTPLPTPDRTGPAATLVGVWPVLCGDGQEVRSSKHLLREGGRNMTMNAIADWLDGDGDYDRPIVNHTNLDGTFDFVLEYARDEEFEHVNPGAAPGENIGPTFLEAIEDQLGLRLKKEEGSIPLFFVDRVEYPSAN